MLRKHQRALQAWKNSADTSSKPIPPTNPINFAFATGALLFSRAALRKTRKLQKTQTSAGPAKKRQKLGGSIFDLDKLFIPMWHDGNHWRFGCIDFNARTITVRDSLVTSTKHVHTVIRDWLVYEHRRVKQTEIDLSAWKDVTECTGHQTDGFSCGMCMLQGINAAMHGKPLPDLNSAEVAQLQDVMTYELCEVAKLLVLGGQ